MRSLAAAALLTLLAAGCSSGAQGAVPTTPEQETVTVLAAASLTEPFTELADAYQKAHPAVSIRTSFGSSTTLAQQVAQGAPADLVAFAGTNAVAQLPAMHQDPSRATIIARNTLEIATPPDNPGAVDTINDLAHHDVRVVLCVATAPCGMAADGLFEVARVVPNVVSRDVDVKATLAKVRLGEVDAAVVYHSDVVSAGDAVRGVPITVPGNPVLPYPLIRLTDSAATRAFADYVAGPAGRAALARHGFMAP